MFVMESDNYVGADARIKELMKRDSVSIATVAKKSGVSYANLTRILKGNYVAITPAFIRKLCNAMGWSSAYVCYGDLLR